MPCKKFSVPSSGSTIQRCVLSLPSRARPSSPRKPWPGRASWISSRTFPSARRSAAVTKLAGPFSEACRCSTSPKSRLSVRLALRAALIITLRRAERSMVGRAGCPPQCVLDARSGGRELEAGVCLQTGFASRAGLERLLERVDPRFGRLFTGGADIRRLLLHECVERDVAHTAGFGDDMPLDGLDRVGLRAAPHRENIGETVLRHRVALARSLRQ